ncbi:MULTISPECIES: AI-2E family transporter [unclassified Gilliamella]|uniref:AI-2E family transporter n=1 Tax=unclassified Gilliamella TaxID=2685620 RepID=UPI001324EAB7|nr:MULTISPECIES: AI-2E family transporter [unclassified Gilliamella]MWN32561.1 AI-2E family transporter [Gilliamella sp. Pra-s60]MWP30049.1 AI-2E family transporter [Gilliamella sp. Pra-s54]
MLLNNNQKLGLFCLALFSVSFIILMQVHLMPAVIAALLTYTLTQKLDDFLSRKMVRFSHQSKLISVLVLTTVIIGIFIGGFWYLFAWFVDMVKHPTETLTNIRLIVNNVINSLPTNVTHYLPDNIDEIESTIMVYLKEHVFYLQSIIKKVFHDFVILIVGMIIGLILGYKENQRNTVHNPVTQRPLTKALKASLNRLVVVFQYVAMSQVVIALFNAIMTAILLFIILPMFGIHLPFSKSLVLATFVFGLIPIIGNLIVNVLIFFVAFTVSFTVAMVIIVYLILIHKMEYVLNAKIVGTKIHAGICELLIAMLFLETLFGVIGLIFAPIFYAFIKLSLKELRIL